MFKKIIMLLFFLVTIFKSHADIQQEKCDLSFNKIMLSLIRNQPELRSNDCNVRANAFRYLSSVLKDMRRCFPSGDKKDEKSLRPDSFFHVDSDDDFLEYFTDGFDEDNDYFLAVLDENDLFGCYIEDCLAGIAPDDFGQTTDEEHFKNPYE